MNRIQIDEEAIFDVARRINSPEARSDYLQQVCGNDRELFQRVKGLLEIHDRDESLFENPPADLALTTDARRTFEQPGDVIGPYKLLQKIGEGGFGVVYMAEQTKPVRRKVALKIIKPGMDSREVVARFEAERQALAMMSHPNIANVLDGGTTAESRPYFAMELVRGVAITEYCDKKKLKSKERLQLFIDVCNAVQHAHQKGVIHRDLKPSNVMVTMHDGKPVVKVIDFGVAKAINQQLTSKTLFTRYGQMVGTPQYMSPEQAEMSGLDVDTRSDIYSLGVLLYELLTGSTPITEDRLKHASYAELQRIICQEELAKPSTRLSTTAEQILVGIADHRGVSPQELREQLRGDLDWIVMKTLEKERERRYGTALELAADVQRFLSDETVLARSPSTSYRLRKYLRRHRTLVASVAALTSVMLIATIVSSGFAVVATTAQRKVGEQLIIAEAERVAAQRERDEKILAVEAEARLRESFEAQASKLEQQLYRTHFMKAKAALDTADPKLFKQIASECPENMRDWEWQRLNFLADDSVYQQVPSRTMAIYTKDSSEFISAGGADAPNAIRVWDARTLECRRTILSGEDHLYACALAPDEKSIAVGSEKGTVSVLSLDTGMELWTKEFVHGPKYVDGLAYSPSGENLASVGTDGRLRLWEVKSGRLLAETHPLNQLRDVNYDPSGRYIVTASNHLAKDSGYRIFDAKTLTQLTGNDHFGSTVTNISITTDGRYIASGGVDGLVMIRPLLAGDITRVLAPNVGKVVKTVQFSPDGNLLAAGGELGMVLWNTSNWQMIWQQSAGRFNKIHWMSFSPDHKNLTVYGDLNDGTFGIRIFGLDGSQRALAENYSFPNSGQCYFASPVFSRDNSLIAVAGTDRLVRIFDAASGKLQRVLRGHSSTVMTVLWSHDGSAIYSQDMDGILKAWDAESGVNLWEKRHEKARLSKRFYNSLMAAIPDNKAAGRKKRTSEPTIVRKAIDTNASKCDRALLASAFVSIAFLTIVSMGAAGERFGFPDASEVLA